MSMGRSFPSDQPCESYFGNVCSGFGGSLICDFCGWERHEHPKDKARIAEIANRLFGDVNVSRSQDTQG